MSWRWSSVFKACTKNVTIMKYVIFHTEVLQVRFTIEILPPAIALTNYVPDQHRMDPDGLCRKVEPYILRFEAKLQEAERNLQINF